MSLDDKKAIVVLHVDDDMSSLMVAEQVLEDAGFIVFQAENGREALQSFKQNSPDLVIMDALMPVMNGFDAISAIRKMPAGEHIPILMITGLDDPESIARAFDVGATDFQAKPINFFTLPYRMQYMLRAKLTADALRYSQKQSVNAHEQVHNLAYFDLMTGLANRAQLAERLGQVLSTAKREKHEFALLFLDLDHFKQVNDTLGHDAGDELLKQVSDRLNTVVRDSDSIARLDSTNGEQPFAAHTVARLGGDEFVVLLSSIKQADDAAWVSERIAQTISQPYTINDTVVSVTTTIGISVFPADGSDSETLMKHADMAMYHMKEKGRNGYQFYSREIQELALARVSMGTDLKKAIENHELSLEFQPKVDLLDHRIVGVEALARWTHETKGVINPSEFIPVAEETGLILPLGRWVLVAACVQMQRWIVEGHEAFSIAVNCSPVQFERGTIIDDVEHALSFSGLDPRFLEVELTEKLFLKDIDAGIETLRNLKALGVQISIDDFGTGFSSLSYLKRLPVDKLKIDHSFVRELEHDRGDAAIVRAIITLAHNLGLEVIAEGVETEGQLNILERYGCNGAQGYFFSRPLLSSEATEWLAERDPTVNVKKVSGF